LEKGDRVEEAFAEGGAVGDVRRKPFFGKNERKNESLPSLSSRREVRRWGLGGEGADESR